MQAAKLDANHMRFKLKRNKKMIIMDAEIWQLFALSASNTERENRSVVAGCASALRKEAFAYVKVLLNERTEKPSSNRSIACRGTETYNGK